MTTIRIDAQGREVAQRGVTPRRVRLTRAALDRLAGLAGVESPAAQVVASDGSLAGLGQRLSTRGADAGRDPDLDPGLDPDLGPDLEALVAAGLVRDGAPTAEGSAVLTVWHSPALAVELELLVVLPRGQVRARSRHHNLDDWVVCVSTADGATFELAWLSADDWWLELGRAAHVDSSTLDRVGGDEPLPDVVETPWELLLATGEAVRRRRLDLLDTMASDHTGLTCAGDSLDTLVAADDGDVRRWHEQIETASCGRLHATVMGRSERGRPGAGIVEWVLFRDGWRALTPFRRDGWAMVRIERTSPVDLPRALAVRAAEVTS